MCGKYTARTGENFNFSTAYRFCLTKEQAPCVVACLFIDATSAQQRYFIVFCSVFRFYFFLFRKNCVIEMVLFYHIQSSFLYYASPRVGGSRVLLLVRKTKILRKYSYRKLPVDICGSILFYRYAKDEILETHNAYWIIRDVGDETDN